MSLTPHFPIERTIFANDSRGNGSLKSIWKNGYKAISSRDSQPANFNDGTNCINAELLLLQITAMLQIAMGNITVTLGTVL